MIPYYWVPCSEPINYQKEYASQGIYDYVNRDVDLLVFTETQQQSEATELGRSATLASLLAPLPPRRSPIP